MAGTPVDVGTGTTIVFATSAFTAEVLSIDWGGISRESVETSHLSTAVAGASEFGSRTFIPGDLSDPGEITMEIHFNPETEPPIDQPPELITVTWPLFLGDVSAASWTCTGFVTEYTASAPLEEVMTGSMTVKLTGNATLVAAV